METKQAEESRHDKQHLGVLRKRKDEMFNLLMVLCKFVLKTASSSET